MRKLALIAAAVLGTAALSVAPASALSPEEKAARIQIKQQAFGGLMFQRAEQVAAGQAEPLMGFDARDSFFVNWVIPRHKVEEFEATLNLPEGFELAPIRIIRGERPRYFLSLNIYEVTIGAPAVRAEWSVYVRTADDPAPRFMVVEAQSSADSFDPALGPVPGVAFEYTRDDEQLHAVIDAGATQFEMSLHKPRRTRFNSRKATLQWAKANDYIYWRNGIADKAYYNGTLTKERMTAVDPDCVEIHDGTPWAQFVRPRPAHVLLFNTNLEFALSPWANLNDPALNIAPEQRAMLQGIKATVFPQLGQLDASLVMNGTGEALVDFKVDMDVPAYFINFRVPYHKVQALEDALNLPAGFHLAPISALRYQYPEFMISLNVYRASGVAAGLRAEWSVYVTPEDDPYTRYFMVVDVTSDLPSLDVVNLATPPAELFTHTVDGDGHVQTDILFDGKSFSLAFDMPGEEAPSCKINQAWARANDRIYWANGVYDRAMYNGTLIDADIAIADPASVVVSDGTPWAEFVDAQPLEVLVFRNALEFRLRPWFNIEEIATEPPMVAPLQ